jgi:sugar O-acyltransferase (sialic acid O-acetyltransferase NeuD family)
MSESVLVIGSSGHASVVIDALESTGRASILGMFDDFEKVGTVKYGRVLLGGIADIAAVAGRLSTNRFIVAIGDNWQRRQISAKLAESVPGAQFVNVIHPRAYLASSVRLGSGNVIAAGALVGPNSHIANGCIVNTGATVDHDCRLEQFSSIGPGVHLGGNVAIGELTAVGIGANVKHKICIGSRTVVGAGALVLADLPDNILAWGSPARVIRPRTPDEPYL